MSNDHDGIDDGDAETPQTPVDPSSTSGDPSSEDEGAGRSAGEDSDAGDDSAAGDDPDDGTDSAAGDDGDHDADDDEATTVGDDRDLVPTGAVAAGSARAAARRSANVRTGVTEKKGRPTAARDAGRDDRGSLFARLGRYLREVVAELRKVIWPNRNQMVTYSIVVIVFVTFMVALVWGLDLLFAKGVLAIFG